MINKNLANIAERASQRARKKGAQEASAGVRMNRMFKVVGRDGKVEEVKAAVSRSLSLRGFVDGRYGRHSTSDLQPAAMDRFIDDAVEMTRFLMPDKYRSLHDPELYKGRSTADLGIYDPNHDKLTMEARKQAALTLHGAARSAGGDKVISVGAGFYDNLGEWVLVNSNGFSDGDRSTLYGQWADVSVKDPSGRRPSDWAQAQARQYEKLDKAAQTGKEAADRALAQIGAKKIESVKLPLIIENRAVGRIVGGLQGPLSGGSLDQKRSCFEKSQGKQVASKLLTITDDPLRKGGWSSRRFDGEGISARKMPIIEAGTLKNFYIDTYYGKKLSRPPTTGGSSNLVFALGSRGLDAICAAAGKAVLVTRFIGGNSNSTTGDFSHGIFGFLVEGGKRGQPIASMNVAGNHKTFWKSLKEVGNDPYRYSSLLAPTLLLKPILVSGK